MCVFFWSMWKKIDLRLARIERTQELMMSAIDDLRAQVEATTNLEASAVTLIIGIAAQLKTALEANDTAALQDLTNQLALAAEPLAAAIAANTAPPAEPPVA